jgi:hypothetical protein
VDGLKPTWVAGEWVAKDRSATRSRRGAGTITHLEPVGDDRGLATSVYPDALPVPSFDEA